MRQCAAVAHLHRVVGRVAVQAAAVSVVVDLDGAGGVANVAPVVSRTTDASSRNNGANRLNKEEVSQVTQEILTCIRTSST